MPQLLRQFETLGEPVTSASGGWALRYDGDGRAVICDRDGTITWAAGAVGSLRLEVPGVFAVYDGDQVVWRAGLPVHGYSSFEVTDDGDGLVYESGLPLYSLLKGPIEPVSLGDRAPATEIGGNQFLESSNGKRTVNRTSDGAALVHQEKFGLTTVVQPAEVRTLEQPDTWLTWRFLDEDGRHAWKLVLVGAEDDVRWVLGRGHVGHFEPDPAPELPTTEADWEVEQGDYSRAWMDIGLRMDDVYCVTVIHDVDPEEALRRFGAGDDQISTATWAELVWRAGHDEVGDDHHVVAAFGLGRHTMLVEDDGWAGADRPDLSLGTFAVSAYCSINADQTFLVSRDGETLATFEDNCLGQAWGAEPDVLTGALAEMGIDDLEAFDESNGYLDDLELLCRIAGIRPRVTDVTGPTRVAIFPRRSPSGRAG